MERKGVPQGLRRFAGFCRNAPYLWGGGRRDALGFRAWALLLMPLSQIILPIWPPPQTAVPLSQTFVNAVKAQGCFHCSRPV
jgi:hypothetical protein